MEVADQVMIIFAGTSGALDSIPVTDVREFEKQYLAYMHDTHPEAAEAIRSAKKDIPDEVKAQLKAAADVIKKQMGA